MRKDSGRQASIYEPEDTVVWRITRQKNAETVDANHYGEDLAPEELRLRREFPQVAPGLHWNNRIRA